MQKPHIIFLSGLLCDSYVWEPVATRLKDYADTDIFSFAGFDDFEVMAAYVLAHSPSEFILVGHSMGARVALEVYRKAPQKVSHIILLNTGVHEITDKEILGRENLLQLAKEQGMEALADTWLPPMLGSKAFEKPILMAELRSMILRHSQKDFQGQIRALIHRPNARETLASITIPTLLMSGTEDNWSPIAQHREMQKHLKQSHLVELQGLGHMSIVEDPQKITEEIQTWLTHSNENHEHKLRTNS